jgi:hypothetical protein
MQADFSVELGGDAPALEIPWRSDDHHVRYYDLKKHPELMQQIPEAVAYPELGAFLARINAAEFPLATAKCDAWASSEVAPEEEIFGDRKFVSYIDLIFVHPKTLCSFEKNEAFAKQLCRLLGHAPEIAATVELVIRHCYWHTDSSASENSTAFENSFARKDSSACEEDSACEDSSGCEDSFGCEDSSACKESPAFQDSSAFQESVGSKNSSEQTDPGLLATERKPGMMPSVNEDTMNRRAEIDLAPPNPVNHRAQTDWAPPDPHGDIAEPADVSFHGQATGITFHNQHGDVQYASLAPSDQGADFTSRHESKRGFCMTAYVTGFGNRDHEPLRQWTIGLNLLLHAIVQLNSNSQMKP